MTFGTLTRQGVSALALGVYLAATPIGLDLDFGDGRYGLKSAKAFAKDGRDDDSGGGNDDSGGNGGSGRDGNGGDDDNSGSGRNDDGDDRDDSSGPGRGGDDGRDGNDDRDDGSRSGPGGGDDDDEDEDNGGRRRGRGPDDAGRAGRLSPDDGGLRVVKIERSASGVEVLYSNGIKEEIENGRYELKNAAGRTVAERPAAPEDRARIDRNVRNSGITALSSGGDSLAVSTGRPPVLEQSQAREIEIRGSGIEVRYDTGWKEEIERGRYELKDPMNTVVERSATPADRDRLFSLAGR